MLEQLLTTAGNAEPAQVAQAGAIPVTVLAFIFAAFIKEKFMGKFPESANKLAKKLLIITVEYDKSGGESFYSKLLKRHIARKKVKELSDKLETGFVWLIRIVAMAVFGVDVSIIFMM